MSEVVDIPWLDSLEDAFSRARSAKRALVVKGLGQGLIPPDDW